MLNRTKLYPVCSETFRMMGENNSSSKNYFVKTFNMNHEKYRKIYTAMLLVILICLLKLNPVNTFIPVSIPLFNYVL